MKISQFFRIVLTSLVLAGCNEASEKVTDITDNTSIDTSSINPFAGTWVRKGYIDTLIFTKSPRASQGSEFFYFIPPILGDTGYTFVFHEGGQQFVVKAMGNKYTLCLPSGDSSIIEKVRDGGIKIAGDEYVRLSKERAENVSEQFLLAGDYLSGNGQVHFGMDGSILGLDTFSYYYVNNDYIGPGLDLDLMYIGAKPGMSPEYSFHFVGDTLLIYTTKCIEDDENGDCLNLITDNLLYRLVRK